MLDLFTIFSKSGIVLWCFQRTSELFTSQVNDLIKNVILEERVGSNLYQHKNLIMQFKLDNEFELVFVVAYQNFIQQSYIDKFLDDVSLEFRDKYKNELQMNNWFFDCDFTNVFHAILKNSEKYGQRVETKPKIMRTFQESQKSKKTIASMIENKSNSQVKNNKKKSAHKKNDVKEMNEVIKTNKIQITENDKNGNITINKQLAQNLPKIEPKKIKGKKEKVNKQPKDKQKKPRVWENSGSHKDMKDLDYSKSMDSHSSNSVQYTAATNMEGEVPEIEYSTDEPESDVEVGNTQKQKLSKEKGIFNIFQKLIGSKNVSEMDLSPIMAKLKDHMIAKNVAAEIADKLCQSITVQLKGKPIGTFSSLASLVKTTMYDSLVKLLSPKRRLDILRDVMEAKANGRPYVMVFCGVNGVGKSTNLAKIAYWLTSNKMKVMIAACDTFRAGAVEQLRTHRNTLNHHLGGAGMVELFERGYGKDPARIAAEAIAYARDSGFDVVLIDTAGRMQDNEPLMQSLAKLIRSNDPDLVVFVGEALVGNEAVDQLVKFNRSLADFSLGTQPHLIDGIMLTKFDTIDDKVGAAISMTYITGQPILFLGTGQMYTDLKRLDAKMVVHLLLK